MPEEEMQNPYEDDGTVEGEIVFGRGAACGLIGAFLLLLLLPPLYRNVYHAVLGGEEAWVPVVELFKKPADKKIIAHLKSFEGELEDRAEFTELPRQFIQGVLAGSFREGNRKTFVGRDGWLFLRPALDAMSGYGPIDPEPDSVAKDPTRKPWAPPLGAIEKFAGQLDELGVELMLVPIPVKPMIYPEHVTGRQYAEPLQHSDAAEFYAKIGALPNVRVLDLTAAFWAEKNDAQLFLKQDTHWTPAGMAIAVEEIAKAIRGADAESEPVTKLGPSRRAESIGDLVDQLELPDGGEQWFLPEQVQVLPVIGFESDPTAKITLLGDSFTNIYSSDSLDWGEGAGLGELLAHRLARPLDVIAINGQASTGVRSNLAKRGREHLAKKEVVVWAIAERDLFLSETAARSANVEWEDVDIPDVADSAKAPAKKKPTAVPAIEVTAKLLAKSPIADPNEVTYKNALFTSDYQIIEVHVGELEGKTVLVKDWAFRDKVLTPAARRQLGDELRLRLVPAASQKEGRGEQEFDQWNDEEDMVRMLQTRYWSLPSEADPIGAKEEFVKDLIKVSRARWAGSIACLLAVILVGVGCRRATRVSPAV